MPSSSEMEDVLTWVLPRGYFTCPDAKEEYSLSLCIPVHSWSFVAPSVPPVSIENGAKVMNEPGNPRSSLADLQEAGARFHRLECGQQVAPALASRMTTVNAPR